MTVVIGEEATNRPVLVGAVTGTMTVERAGAVNHHRG